MVVAATEVVAMRTGHAENILWLPGIAAVVFLVWLTRRLRKRRRLLTDH